MTKLTLGNNNKYIQWAKHQKSYCAVLIEWKMNNMRNLISQNIRVHVLSAYSLHNCIQKSGVLLLGFASIIAISTALAAVFLLQQLLYIQPKAWPLRLSEVRVWTVGKTT